jgi:hypothetical protein
MKADAEVELLCVYLFLGEIYPAKSKPIYATIISGTPRRKIIINKLAGGSIKLLTKKRSCETKINHKAERFINRVCPP